MNRYAFARPKPRWNAAFMFEFIGRHPRLSSSQIRDIIANEYGSYRTVSEVHAMIYVLRKSKKVKVVGGLGPKGGMVYEQV